MSFMEYDINYWNGVIQFGILAVSILVANSIRRKVSFIRRLSLPTAIIAGFILLILKYIGLINIDINFMQSITYHSIALGFIALTLRNVSKYDDKLSNKTKKEGFNTGVVIVSTYLIQGLTGLITTMILSYLGINGMYKAMGMLLPMGYGQGPGQANNIGTIYEISHNYTGAISFSLAIATTGFLWACIGGVAYINYLKRNGKYSYNKLNNESQSEVLSEENEIPLTEAVDKFTVQISFIFMIYLLTYILSYGVCYLFANIDILKPIENSIVPLIWGFNFLTATILTLATRKVLGYLRIRKIMNRNYINNYMLNRVSGVCFDFMIVASISIINIDDLKNLLLPFILITTSGGITTFIYLKYITKRLYPTYKEEAMVSLYGMLTGTVSSGILLLREIDPEFKTCASDNLVLGSANGILLGAPMLIFVVLVAMSDTMFYITFLLIVIYFILLSLYLLKSSSDLK